MEYKCGKDIFFRRVCAFLLDFLCISITFMILLSIFDAVVMNSKEYKNAESMQNQICINSHLFIDDGNGSVKSVVGNARDEALKEFYIMYTGNYDVYNSHKDEYIGSLFYVDTETGEYKMIDEYDVEEYNNFLAQEMKTAYKDYLCKDEEYLKYKNVTGSYINTIFTCAIAVPVILFLYFLPVLFKKRQTIGKKIMKLEVINMDTGNNLSEGFYTLRFIVLVVEFLSVGVFAIVSLFICIFTKKGLTIHDFLVRSLVVCKQNDYESEKDVKELNEVNKSDGTSRDKEENI